MGKSSTCHTYIWIGRGPSVLDHNFKEDKQWGEVPGLDSSFDDYGDYKYRVVVHLAYFHRQDGDLLDDVLDQCVLDSQTSQVLHEPVFYDAHETEIAIPQGIPLEPTPSGPTVVSKCETDYDQLRPFFGWISPDLIKKTFQNTTQYARLPAGTWLKKVYKSPNPALNVFRCQGDVACDIVYSDIPAIYDGSTAAVIFAGTNTQVTDVYGIKTDKQFINTLEDNIIQHGAPMKLISDRDQVLQKDVTRPLRIVLITFLTVLELLPIHGYWPYYVCVSC
jgi:hypothetical protein